MENPVLSVIIPVYNCEKYIKRAILSVAKQPCADALEIIVVDDGSKDGTGKVCDETAKKFNNIRIFHRQNSGAGASRNFAIDNAAGKYVAFLDADDWWDKAFFDESLKNEMATEDTDVYQFGYATVSWNLKYRKVKRVEEGNFVYDKPERWRYDWSYFCNFIYRKEFLDKNSLRFLPTKVNEDQPFVDMSLYLCKTFKKKSKQIFTYWSNQDSCLHTTDAKEYFNEKYKAFLIIKQWYEDRGEEYNDGYDVFMIFHEMIYPYCAFHKWADVEREILTDERLSIIKDYAKYPLWKHLEKCAKAWTKNPKKFWRKCRLCVRPKLKAKEFLYSHPKLRGIFDYFFYKYKMKYEKVKDDDLFFVE